MRPGGRSWLLTGPPPEAVAIWGVESADGTPLSPLLSLYLCLANKQSFLKRRIIFFQRKSPNNLVHHDNVRSLRKSLKHIWGDEHIPLQESGGPQLHKASNSCTRHTFRILPIQFFIWLLISILHKPVIISKRISKMSLQSNNTDDC